MKKLISMFVVLVMMFAALPISSCSDNEEEVLDSLQIYSITGEWLITWASESMGDGVYTVIISKKDIEVYINNNKVDYYRYTLGGNMLTLGDIEKPVGYITIEKLTKDVMKVKINDLILNETYKMDLSRID